MESTNPYTPIATFGYALNRTGLGGVTQPGYTLEVGGDGRFNTDLGVSRNLTVSGVLQSPLTSLIGVSISSLNNSIGGFSSKLAIGKVHSGYANIELRSNQSGAGALALSPKSDNTENSIYFNPSAVSSSYTPGTTGTWVVGNNVAATSGNAFSVWNPSSQNHHLKLNIDGSSNLIGGLSVGGAVTTTGNATIGGELTSNGGYFNQTNRGLFMGTTFSGTSVFADSLNIRDGYLSVYDPGLYGYGLVINGYSFLKTNSAHDCLVLGGAFNLAQDDHLYALDSYIVTSSEKIKSNIRDIEDSDLIHNISFKRYSKMHTNEIGITSIKHDDMGVIAEQLQGLDPDDNFKLVIEKDDQVFVDYNRLFLLGLVEIQKNLRKITQLENKITQLENDIKDIIKIKNHPIFKNYTG